MGIDRVAPTNLTSALQDLIPNVLVAGADDTGNSGHCNITIRDAQDDTLAEYFLFRTWLSTSDFGAPEAQSVFNVTTGTEVSQTDPGGDSFVLSTNGGLAEMLISLPAPGVIYCMVEIDGRVYSSGAINITA